MSEWLRFLMTLLLTGSVNFDVFFNLFAFLNIRWTERQHPPQCFSVMIYIILLYLDIKRVLLKYFINLKMPRKIKLSLYHNFIEIWLYYFT